MRRRLNYDGEVMKRQITPLLQAMVPVFLWTDFDCGNRRSKVQGVMGKIL